MKKTFYKAVMCNKCLLLVVFMFLQNILIFPSPAVAGDLPELRVNRDRITIHGSDLNLISILNRVASETGIIIKVDPDVVTKRIQIDADELPPEAFFKKITKPYSHAIIWARDEDKSKIGPASEHRILEVHIFKEGHKDRIVLLSSLDTQLATDTGEPTKESEKRKYFNKQEKDRFLSHQIIASMS